MIFNLEVRESILLIEIARSSIKTPKINEGLIFKEKLDDRKRRVSISERISFVEKTRHTGIHNVTISEHLTFVERPLPRVLIYDVYEVLHFTEKINNHNIYDKLTIVETLVGNRARGLFETLDIIEIAKFVAHRNILTSEHLTIIEGLSNYLIKSNVHRIAKCQYTSLNRHIITLQLDDFFVQLPSPDFDNVEGFTYTRVNKRTRGGDLIIYRDSYWPKSRSFSYTWSNLKPKERNTLLYFMLHTLGRIVTLVDYENRTFSVYIKNPDSEFTESMLDQHKVKLDFETA